MMVRALAFSLALLLLAASPVVAEWQLTPMLGLTFKGNTTLNNPGEGAKDVHRHFGGAVSLLSGGVVGVEGVFVYTPAFFDPGPSLVPLGVSSRSYALMGNVVATLPRRWTEYSLRPFVSGGLGLMALRKEEKVVPFDLHLAGLNIGGGAVGFLSKRVGLRFDLRYFKNLRGTEEGPISFGPVHIRYMTASVGVVFRR